MAAGGSTRFGGAKALAPLRGRPLVTWALDAARVGGLSPLVLVVGAESSRVGALGGPDIEVVTAPDWQLGLAHSLGAGLAALEDRPVDAVCVGLGDQPLVGAAAYRRLVRAHAAGAEFAVCTYGGERRNPVLLGRELWTAARALTADEGARALMREHPPVEVSADGIGDPTDVDTPEDLAELEIRCASMTNSE